MRLLGWPSVLLPCVVIQTPDFSDSLTCSVGQSNLNPFFYQDGQRKVTVMDCCPFYLFRQDFLDAVASFFYASDNVSLEDRRSFLDPAQVANRNNVSLDPPGPEHGEDTTRSWKKKWMSLPSLARPASRCLAVRQSSKPLPLVDRLPRPTLRSHSGGWAQCAGSAIPHTRWRRHPT